jgi:hypothetical protein
LEVIFKRTRCGGIALGTIFRSSAC